MLLVSDIMSEPFDDMKRQKRTLSFEQRVLKEFALNRKMHAAHTKRFDTIEKRLDGHDKRFDAVDKRFDVVDQQFDAVDKRFGNIDRQVDALAMAGLEHDKRLDRIETTMATKEDLKRFATKEDLKELATKQDLRDLTKTLDHLVVIAERNSQENKSHAHCIVRLEDIARIHTKEINRIKVHVGLQ